MSEGDSVLAFIVHAVSIDPADFSESLSCICLSCVTADAEENCFFIWIPPMGLCLIELYIIICIGGLNVTGKTKRPIPAKQELRRFDMISYFYLDKLRLVLFEIGQILKACRLRHFYACGNIPADICGAVGV